MTSNLVVQYMWTYSVYTIFPYLALGMRYRTTKLRAAFSQFLQVWFSTHRLCWVGTYLGPPYLVTSDAGKYVMAGVFQQNSPAFNIHLRALNLDSLHSMSIVERYHAPIRRAYNAIWTAAPSLDPEAVPPMAIKSVSNSVGPHELTSTLLVYGAMPLLGLSSDPPSPSLYERTHALRKVTKEVTDYFTCAPVYISLRTSNVPWVLDAQCIPLGGHVLE